MQIGLSRTQFFLQRAYRKLQSCAKDLFQVKTSLLAFVTNLYRGRLMEEWPFHFGFVMPNTTNSWENVIEADSAGVLGASLLRWAGLSISRLILENDFGDKIPLFYIVTLWVHLLSSFILTYVKEHKKLCILANFHERQATARYSNRLRTNPFLH